MQRETEILLNQHSKFSSCFKVVKQELLKNAQVMSEHIRLTENVHAAVSRKDTAFVHVLALKRTAVRGWDICED